MEKKIKFGEFECNVTTKLYGLDDPIVKFVIGKMGSLDWTDYKLYVHGSILNDSPANDIDFTITGPQDPTRVNDLLRDCVRCGYETNVQVDIKFLLSGELFDFPSHTPGDKHSCMYAHYAPSITVNGTTYDYAQRFSGYWITQKTWPSAKSYLSPQSPVLIEWH